MLPQKRPTDGPVESKTYPLVEKSEQADAGNVVALVALSHTPVEQRLYTAMLSFAKEAASPKALTARELMTMTGIRSSSTMRRALEGLLVKLSIDKNGRETGESRRDQAHVYRVYSPGEVITRRKELGGTSLGGYAQVPSSGNGNHVFDKAIARVAENPMLSRREAQVALCCVEGLTNAEIGKRLDVSEQTVKFHLRHIFVKFGVKRRAELISRLLM
jgi:DNA-binding CsgD family transcriptional regulator